MAFEYKRKNNKNETSAETKTPKFTYSRDRYKQENAADAKTPTTKKSAMDFTLSQPKYKDLLSEETKRDALVQAIFSPTPEYKQYLEIVDRNNTKSDADALAEIEKLKSEYKNELNPFGKKNAEDIIKPANVETEKNDINIEDVVLPEFRNEMRPFGNTSVADKLDVKNADDITKLDVPEELVGALEGAYAKKKNKYRIFNGKAYDLEELRNEGIKIPGMESIQEEYEQAVSDYDYLSAMYDSYSVEESIPLDIKEKYGAYISQNEIGVTQYANALKDDESAGSEITKAILNSQVAPDSFGGGFDYVLNMNSDKYNAAQMSKKERDLYFSIMMNEGVAAADEYYNDLEPHLKRRRKKEFDNMVVDVTREANAGEKVVLSLGEVASTVLSPLDYPLKAYEVLSGNPTGVTNFTSALQNATNEIARGISEDSPFWSWAYQLGVAGAKSLVSMGITGVNPMGVTFVMGADAASSTMVEAEKRGLTPEQTIIYGTLVGIIEGVSEQIGLEALLGDAPNIISYILKNAAAEGGEEVVAEVFGNVADILVNTDKSQMLMNVEQYKASGMDDQEAYSKAILDFLGDVVVSFAGGATLGGMFGTGGAITQTVQQNIAQREADESVGGALVKGMNSEEEIATLIENAKESNNKKLKNIADKVEKSKYDFGELGTKYNAEQRDIGKLARLSEENRRQHMLEAAKYDNATRREAIQKIEEGGFDKKTAEKAFETLMRDLSKEQVSTELGDYMRKNKSIRPLYESLSDYYSDSAISRRVNKSAAESPVTKVMERVENTMMKDSGINVVENSNEETYNDNIEKEDAVSIESVDEYGDITVKTRSGKSVVYNENDYTLSNSTHSKLGYAKLFSINGAKAYFALAPDNASHIYDSHFAEIYRQGINNKPFAQIQSNIPIDVQKAIYEAGKADLEAAQRDASVQKQKAKEKEAAFVKKQMGFKSNRVTVSDAALDVLKVAQENDKGKQYKSAVEVIEGLAKMMQVNINIVASNVDEHGNYVGANGSYNRRTNTFTFDITSGMDNISDITYTAMIKTAGHELTHFIQNWSPSKYIKLKNTTLNYLKKTKGDAWVDKRIHDAMADNAAIGQKLTLEQAKDELVADAFENVLTEIDFAETVLRTDKGLFEKIHSWVKSNVNKFNKALQTATDEVGAQTEAGKIMEKAGAEARKLYQEWADAFATALENSTSFTMESVVEQKKDLVAFHNITYEQLTEALKRGRLFMPSVAVTNKGMTDFGDISLLFDKSTIDPNVTESKLYGADAWTPTRTKLKKNAKFDRSQTNSFVKRAKGALGDRYAELFGYTAQQIENAVAEADGSIYDAFSKNKGMQAIYASEVGISEEKIDSVLDTDKGWRAYKKWLNGISDTLITNYESATDEDILENMKKQKATAKEFKLSLDGQLVTPAAEYSSIEELRGNKNRLSENAETETKAVAKELLAWSRDVTTGTKSTLKDVVSVLNDTFKNRYSVEDIINSFAEQGVDITRSEAKELQNLYKKAVELPTRYFEAKPQRAVDVSEIKAVVMPDESKTADLAERFGEMGIKVITYDNSFEQSRVDAINSVDDVKFSARTQASENTDAQNQARTTKLALDKFGTTEDVNKAGFAIDDGRMLNLGKTNARGTNHILIESVYDDVKGNQAINKFIQEGNVRFKAMAPGIEIGAKIAPTAAQLEAMSRFYNTVAYDRGMFYLDITGESGEQIASVKYGERDNWRDVAYDIDKYYKDGKIPKTSSYNNSNSLYSWYQARSLGRLDTETRRDLVDMITTNGFVEKRNADGKLIKQRVKLDERSKLVLKEYKRNIDAYAAAETTWRVAKYHNDTDSIIAAGTAMELRKETIYSIERTKEFANLVGHIDIPNITTENGLTKETLERVKNVAHEAKKNLSEAEIAAITWSRKLDVAGQKVYDSAMRRMRLENSQALTQIQSRLKQAKEKPNARFSIPEGGEKLAESLQSTAKEISKLLSSKSTFSPEAETIALIKEAAIIGAGKDVANASTYRPSASVYEALGGKYRSEFKKLARMYEAMQESEALALVYSPDTASALKDYISATPDENEVWSYIFDGVRLVKALSHDLINANKVIIAKRAENLANLRTDLVNDFDNIAPQKSRKILVNEISSIVQTPQTFLHAVFGATESADKLYQIYNDGQNRYIDVILAARDVIASVDEKYRKADKNRFKNRLMSETPTVDMLMYDTNGNKVKTNEEHAISFVLAAKNADYRRHIMYGGMEIPNLEKLYKGKDAYLDKVYTEHILDGKNESGKLIDYVTVNRGGNISVVPRIDFKAIAEMRAMVDEAIEKGELDEAIGIRVELALVNQEIRNIESEWHRKIEEAAASVETQLSPYAKDVMRSIDYFYNKTSSDFLDEATMERYGYKKTLDKNHYYPIRVEKTQLETVELNSLVKQDTRISALGMMKYRQKSRKACILFGAVSNFGSIVEDIAKYYGYLNTINYVNKITGVNFENAKKDSENDTRTDIITLSGHIDRVLGNKTFTKYLQVLESDLSGGKATHTGVDTFIDYMNSAFIVSALAFNVSPQVKQLSALPLVYPDAGFTATVKGMIRGAATRGEAGGKRKLPIVLNDAQKRYVAKYSKIYAYRAGGLLSVDFAQLKQSGNKIAKLMNENSFATGMDWLERTDAQALGLQFYAILEMVKKQNPSLSPTQAAEKAGKLLDETIFKFQANYTVLQRAPLVRSKGSSGMKVAKLAIGTFKSQQLTILNAKIDSALKVFTIQNQIEVLESKGKTENASKIAELRNELKKANKYAIKIAAAEAASYILNAAFAIGIMLAYRKKDFDDELLEEFAWDFAESYMIALPGIGDTASFITKQITDRGYNGDRLADAGLFGVINDTVDVFTRIGKGDLTFDRVFKDAAKLLAPFGIPARNVYNIAKAIFGWCGIEAD